MRVGGGALLFTYVRQPEHAGPWTGAGRGNGGAERVSRTRALPRACTFEKADKMCVYVRVVSVRGFPPAIPTIAVHALNLGGVGEARGGADGVCVRRATTYRCRADLLDLDVVQRAGVNRPHLQMPAAATEESQQRDGVAHATGAGATATR